MADKNLEAQDELGEEMRKIGLTPDLPEVTDEKEEDKETPENKEEDESEETSEEEEESDDEDDSDEKDEDSDEDEDSKNKKSGKFIPKYKFDRRMAKESAEKAELQKTVGTLTERLDALEKKDAPAKPSKLAEKAKAAGLDEDAIKNLSILSEAIKEDLEASSGRLNPDIQKKIDLLESKLGKYEQSDALANDAKIFNSSWTGYVPELEKEYPNISSQELEKVKSFIDKVWHTEKFADKEIDYVVFRHRDKIDELISPRNKGLETGRSQGNTSRREKKTTLSKNPSDSEIKDMDKLLSDAVIAEDSLKPVEYSGI